MQMSRQSVAAYHAGRKAAVDNFDYALMEEYANSNITLVVVPDGRMVEDADQAFELGVMGVYNDHCLDNRINMMFGYLDQVIQAEKSGRFKGQRICLVTRYGFLETTCRLHDMSRVLLGLTVDQKSWMEPGIGRRSTWQPHWPNDFSFWYQARWAEILGDAGLSPKTWFDKGWANVPDTKSGAWIVKGTLRSIRQDWDNRMYANSREKLRDVMGRVYDDSRISQYGLMIREYCPIKTLGEWDYSISTETYKKVEFRVHIYNGIPFFSHYYWGHLFEIKVPQEIIDFAVKCYGVTEYQGWASVDVAVGADGNLFCVEMNCGPSSGSPGPEVLWPNFIRAFVQSHKDNDAPSIVNRF